MSFSTRIKSLFDQGAWLLMLPASLSLYQMDPAMFMTIGQWLLVALVLAGLTIIVSRIIFPQVDLRALAHEVLTGNIAAAILAASLVLCVGLIFIGLVLWARA